MPIHAHDVRRIAALARLEIDPDSLGSIAAELTQIVEFFDQLAEADTGGVAEFPRPATGRMDLRADAVGLSLPVAAALHNAPETDGDYFKVPRVVKK